MKKLGLGVLRALGKSHIASHKARTRQWPLGAQFALQRGPGEASLQAACPGLGHPTWSQRQQPVDEGAE